MQICGFSNLLYGKLFVWNKNWFVTCSLYWCILCIYIFSLRYVVAAYVLHSYTLCWTFILHFVYILLLLVLNINLCATATYIIVVSFRNGYYFCLSTISSVSSSVWISRIPPLPSLQIFFLCAAVLEYWLSLFSGAILLMHLWMLHVSFSTLSLRVWSPSLSSWHTVTGCWNWYNILHRDLSLHCLPKKKVIHS